MGNDEASTGQLVVDNQQERGNQGSAGCCAFKMRQIPTYELPVLVNRGLPPYYDDRANQLIELTYGGRRGPTLSAEVDTGVGKYCIIEQIETQMIEQSKWYFVSYVFTIFVCFLGFNTGMQNNTVGQAQ